MRVLFFIPSSNLYDREVNLNEPLGACSVAASVRESGHEVKIVHQVDPRRQKMRDLVSESLGFRPDLVALSTMTESHRNGISMVQEIRKVTKVFSVLGGIHVTSYPRAVLGEAIDFAIMGEGERTLPKLLEKLSHSETTYEEIPGLIWKRGEQIHGSQAFERIHDLDRLPWPIRDSLPHGYYKNYQAAHRIRISQQRLAAVSASRGCPFNCIFCPNNILTKGRVVLRSVESVLEEIQALQMDRKINFINFSDENFGFRRDWLKAFCLEIKRKNRSIPYFANVSISDMDEERILLLTNSGCVMANVGIETGDDVSLERIHKQLSTRQALSVLKDMRRKGLAVTANFLLGFPWEDTNSIRRGLKMIRQMDAMWFGLNYVVPFPGTELLEMIREEDLPVDENFDRYTGKVPIAPTRYLDKEAIQRFGREMNRTFYLRRAYLRRMILYFLVRPKGFFPYISSLYHIGIKRGRLRLLFGGF